MVEGNLNFILDLSSGNAFSEIQIFLCAISQRKEMSTAEGKSLAMKTMKTLNKSKTAILCFESTFRNEHRRRLWKHPKLQRKRKVTGCC